VLELHNTNIFGGATLDIATTGALAPYGARARAGPAGTRRASVLLQLSAAPWVTHPCSELHRGAWASRPSTQDLQLPRRLRLAQALERAAASGAAGAAGARAGYASARAELARAQAACAALEQRAGGLAAQLQARGATPAPPDAVPRLRVRGRVGDARPCCCLLQEAGPALAARLVQAAVLMLRAGTKGRPCRRARPRRAALWWTQPPRRLERGPDGSRRRRDGGRRLAAGRGPRRPARPPAPARQALRCRRARPSRAALRRLAARREQAPQRRPRPAARRGR